MAIIYLGKDYNEALVNANIVTLPECRIAACKRFISGLTPQNPLYELVLDRIHVAASSYQLRLRSNNGRFLKLCNTNRFNEFVTNKFALELNKMPGNFVQYIIIVLII